MHSLTRLAIVLVVPLAVLSCSEAGVGPDGHDPGEPPDLTDLPVSAAVVEVAPLVRGVTTEVALVSGSGEVTGKVIVTTRWGTPDLLSFPYLGGHRTHAVLWEVPLGWIAGSEGVVAAFAQVGLRPAWGAGEPITSEHEWGTYASTADYVFGGGPDREGTTPGDKVVDCLQ